MDPGTMAVISIVSQVISVGMKLQAASQAKKDAKRRAALQQAQLDITSRQRAAEQERQRISVARSARARRASVLNTAAGAGVVFTSPVEGARQGITSQAGGDINFINQGAALATQADAITGQQISLAQDIAVANAASSQFSAVVGGIGSIASTIEDAPPETFSNLFNEGPPAGVGGGGG